MKRQAWRPFAYPVKFNSNKKDLLRECKRHTARRVASARYAALSNGGGYPIQSWGEGVSHPIMMVGGYPITPSSHCGGGGVPQVPLVQSWDGVPPPDLGWGTPLSRSGMGYPPHPDLGWGTPPSRPGMGYPPVQTWDGVPPSRPEMGYSPIQTWDGVPPPI